MRKHLFIAIRVVFLGMAFVTLGGVSSCTTTPTQTIDITILHTNDIHSHLRAEPATSEKNPFNLGGVAKLKTLVNQIRATRANTILLDAGDWSEAIMPFAADAGANMLQIFSNIGYNAVVVGNHDFLNGVPELYNTITRANPAFPVLGANKDLSAVPNNAAISKLIQPYVILNVGGVRVAIIGLLTEDPTYEPYFSPGVITDAVTAATTITTMLHNQKMADVIVLLSHNAIASNVAWASQIPWVNAVISGHTHAKTPQPIVVTNAGNPVYIAETKQWGQFLGDMTLTVNPATGQVTLKQYTLHPVTSDLAEDPQVAAIVTATEQTLATKYGVANVMTNQLAECDDEMVHDDVREVPLGNLAVDAYRAASGAQMALEEVSLQGDGITPGPLSTFNLFNIAPHIYGPIPGQPFPAQGRNWTLKNFTFTGATVRSLLNLGFLAQTAGLLGRLALSGAQVTYLGSGSNPGGNPVQSISVLDPATQTYQPIVNQQNYTVTLHDGLLTALTVIENVLNLSIDLSQYQETGIQTWSAVTNFVTSLGTVHASAFQAGTRYNATTADLGFYEHDIALVTNPATPGKYSLNVTIRNEGLTASTVDQMMLHVLRSPPNDVLNDFTGNEKTPISADIPVPPLAPGQGTTVNMPWLDLPGPGIYSLQFELIGSDANSTNNAVLVHRTIPAQ